MFFGLNEFSKALQRGEERRKSDRLDNAKLYNDFLSANPGATVQERMDYANNLIRETGAGLGGLPSKAQMQRNFDKYTKAQAKKEAEEARIQKERERKIALENRRLAKEIGNDLATMYGTDGFEDQLKTQFEEFGINPNLIPAATANAKETAWTKWKENNSNLIQAYMDNPTKENLEAIKTAAGTLWMDDATSAYEGRHTSWINNNKSAFSQELEELGRTATSTDDYNSKLRQLKLKYPPEVYSKIDFGSSLNDVTERRKDEYVRKLEELKFMGLSVAEYNARVGQLNDEFSNEVLNLTNADFDSAGAFVIKERTKAMQREIDALGTMDDQGAYDRAVAEIKSRYSDTLIPNFANTDELVAKNIEEKNKQIQLGLQAKALQMAESAQDLEGYNQYKVALNATAPEGVVIDYTLADKRFEKLEADRNQADTDADVNAARQAVNNSDGIVDAAVKGNTTVEKVIADIEQQLTDQQGRKVELTEAQRKAVEEKFSLGERTLTAQIEQIANASVSAENPEIYLGDTEEKFVENFLNDIRAQGITPTQKHEKMARTQFQVVLDKVRANADKQEAQTLQTVTQEMEGNLGANRNVTMDLAELIDVQKAILSNSNVFGKDINVEEAGPKLASDINAMLTNIATDLNIPMSQEMAVAVINELNNMASERGDDGFALLENGKITRAILNDAFGRAHVRNPFAGQKHINIEKVAMEDALNAVKLDSIEDLLQLDRGDPKLAMFQQAYAREREETRRAVYDIHRGSVADDMVPAQTAIDNSTQAMTVISEQQDILNAAMQLSDLNAFDTNLTGSGAVTEAIEKTSEVYYSLETASNNLEGEINRLSQLLKSELYNENLADDRATLQNNLKSLTEKKKEVDSAIKAIEANATELTNKVLRGETERKRLDEENARKLAEETARRKAEEKQREKIERQNNSFQKGTPGDRLNRILDFLTDPVGGSGGTQIGGGNE